MFVKLGALYVDSVVDDADAARPSLINRVGEPGEVAVFEDDPILLTVVDVGAAGLAATLTTITIVTTAGSVVVWNGTTFHADWAASSFVAARSDGVGPDDEHRFVLIRSTPFESEELITITVHAETLDASTLDETYSFTIRDFIVPQIVSARSDGLKRIRIQFTEAVVQGTGEAGDALRIRQVPSPEFIAPMDLQTNVDTFSAEDVGLFVGVAGAQNSRNNHPFRITTFISARRVTLDAPVVTEVLPTSAIVTAGPYKLQGVLDPDRVIPVFTPTIIGAEAGSSSDVLTLLLHEELSPERDYQITPFQVDDIHGNRLETEPSLFTCEPLAAPPGRNMSLVDAIPNCNYREDASRDLERFMRCLDEARSILLHDIDRFNELMDPDLAPDEALDVLLAHLGNPFRFASSLAPQDKRRLIAALKQIYNRNGTEFGVEAVINFILGVQVNVRPFAGVEGYWVLGMRALGVDTILAPGTQYLLYSFEVISPIDLTDAQRAILIEIVEYMKPAHTHFIRLLEPGDGGGGPAFPYWILGTGALGTSTALGF